MIIDFNPEEVRRLRKLGFDAIYGDAGDQEFIVTLPLEGTECVILAMPQDTSSLNQEDQRVVLIDALKRNGYRGKIAVTVQHSGMGEEEAKKCLLAHGADMVFPPYRDAAKNAVEQLEIQFSKGK